MKLSQFEVKPQRRNSLFAHKEKWGARERERINSDRGQKTRVLRRILCLCLRLGLKVEFAQPQKCDKCNNSCKASQQEVYMEEKPQ